MRLSGYTYLSVCSSTGGDKRFGKSSYNSSFAKSIYLTEYLLLWIFLVACLNFMSNISSLLITIHLILDWTP